MKEEGERETEEKVETDAAVAEDIVPVPASKLADLSEAYRFYEEEDLGSLAPDLSSFARLLQPSEEELERERERERELQLEKERLAVEMATLAREMEEKREKDETEKKAKEEDEEREKARCAALAALDAAKQAEKEPELDSRPVSPMMLTIPDITVPPPGSSEVESWRETGEEEVDKGGNGVGESTRRVSTVTSLQSYEGEQAEDALKKIREKYVRITTSLIGLCSAEAVIIFLYFRLCLRS